MTNEIQRMNAFEKICDPLPADRMVKYPFPIRDSICCFLEVPRDLTRDEARKIHLFLMSLTIK